jgi:hypothetical protein
VETRLGEGRLGEAAPFEVVRDVVRGPVEAAVGVVDEVEG